MSTAILTDMNDDRHQRHIERLEERRRLINARLDKQRERINARLDRHEAQLGRRLNVKQEQIIAAALELLRAKGLNELSLRDIAKSLHMQAPALYWYFKSKEELIDVMAEAILDQEFANMQPRRDDETWQDWLIQHMSQLRHAMLAYPDGARVVAGAHIYPAVTLAKSMEYSLVSLQSAGIDLHIARHIILTATHYTFGFVIEEQAAPTAEQMAQIDLDELLAPYPNMARAVADIHAGGLDPDKNFVIGLEYIIRGSQA